MKKTLIATLVAGAAIAMAAGQATAGVLDFDQRSAYNPDLFVVESPVNIDGTGFESGFSLPTAPDNDGTKYQATATDKKLDWGFGPDANPEPNSSLEVTTYHSGGVQQFAQGGLSPTSDGSWDAGEYWTITRLTQTNEVINGFGLPMWTAVVENITGFSSGATVINQNTADVFSFFETNNAPGAGGCDPSIAEASGLGGECPDYYLALESILDTVVVPFDGHLYAIDFRLEVVQNATIANFGDGGNFDVITPELTPDPNDPNFNVSIVDVQAAYRKIPVPGTLALLGLGLAGLGFRNRRKNG